MTARRVVSVAAAVAILSMGLVGFSGIARLHGRRVVKAYRTADVKILMLSWRLEGTSLQG